MVCPPFGFAAFDGFVGFDAVRGVRAARGEEGQQHEQAGEPEDHRGTVSEVGGRAYVPEPVPEPGPGPRPEAARVAASRRALTCWRTATGPSAPGVGEEGACPARAR